MTEQLGDYEPLSGNNPPYDFEVEHLPEDVDTYYEHKTAALHAGEPTWIVRNFDVDNGRTYDFCTLNDKGGVYQAYAYGAENEEPVLCYSGDDIAQAVSSVEAQL